MEALTLDQVQVFVTVVEEGSFSGAARSLGRAQSAVTYAVQKLEAQVGAELFDRSGYRPVPTEAARALLPRARRIAAEAAAFRTQARGIVRGLEPELTLVVDSLFPMSRLFQAMRAFSARFPSVVPRIFVELLGAAAELVIDGTCTIGLVSLMTTDSGALDRTPLLAVDLLPVAAADHPLARIDGPIPSDVIRSHVQLVLTDRSGLTEGRDYGVISPQVWRLADLGAKHAMLLAGTRLGQHAVPPRRGRPAGRAAAPHPAGRLRRRRRNRLPGHVLRPAHGPPARSRRDLDDGSPGVDAAGPVGPTATSAFPPCRAWRSEGTRCRAWSSAACRPRRARTPRNCPTTTGIRGACRRNLGRT